MKRPIIADSSGIISLVSETDRNHAAALAQSEHLIKSTGTIIVPSDVFTETVNILGKKVGHTFALQTASILLNEPAFVIMESDMLLRKQALDKFQHRSEAVSLTDCMVMAVADNFETKDIFGFDEVFAHNDYHALPGS